MKNVFSALVLSGLLITLPNLASGNNQTGTHGGQVRAVGPYHLELVAKDGELQLFVTDQNNLKNIQAKGGAAKANISDSDGNRVNVQLKPVFGNLMRGSGDFKITPETTISVLIATGLEKDTHMARFDSLTSQNTTAEAAASSDHNHDEDAAEATGSDHKHDEDAAEATDSDHKHDEDTHAHESEESESSDDDNDD